MSTDIVHVNNDGSDHPIEEVSESLKQEDLINRTNALYSNIGETQQALDTVCIDGEKERN